jgi:hypothetical protein
MSCCSVLVKLGAARRFVRWKIVVDFDDLSVAVSPDPVNHLTPPQLLFSNFELFTGHVDSS